MLDRRADGGGRNRQNGANHPFGTRPQGAEAHEGYVFVCYTLKVAQKELGGQAYRYIVHLDQFPDGRQGRHALVFYFGGLTGSTAIQVAITTAAHIGTLFQNRLPSLLQIELEQMGVGLFVDQQARTLEANTFADPDDLL